MQTFQNRNSRTLCRLFRHINTVSEHYTDFSDIELAEHYADFSDTEIAEHNKDFSDTEIVEHYTDFSDTEMVDNYEDFLYIYILLKSIKRPHV